VISYYDMDTSTTVDGRLDRVDGPPLPWRQAVARRLDDLGRWVEGRFVLTPGPEDRVIAAERFLDAGFLRETIGQIGVTQAVASADGSTADLRIPASRLTRQYCASMTATALVGLTYGIGLDLSAARWGVVLRSGDDIHVSGVFRAMLDSGENEVLRCAERPTPWLATGPVVETVDELRAYVWGKLYGENIGQMFDAVLAAVNVAPRLLWANAAEWVGMVADAAEEYLDPASAAPFVAECRALLEVDRLPGLAGPNPLRDQLDWVPYHDGRGYPHAIQTRRVCCLTYLLKDRYGRLCANCPYLPPADCAALIRERHGVSQSGPRGEAEQQAIRQGLAKIEHKQ
jgi:Ferric iron reductase FhuF-like transporter